MEAEADLQNIARLQMCYGSRHDRPYGGVYLYANQPLTIHHHQVVPHLVLQRISAWVRCYADRAMFSCDGGSVVLIVLS